MIWNVYTTTPLGYISGRTFWITCWTQIKGTDTATRLTAPTWEISFMVGTAQTNRTRADVAKIVVKMKKGTYESVCWQHKMRPLCFAVWLDIALVKMLSDFHGPEILKSGLDVMQKRRDDDGRRERHNTKVPCPVHMGDYCKAFH
jgi:hypothetical protein